MRNGNNILNKDISSIIIKTVLITSRIKLYFSVRINLSSNIYEDSSVYKTQMIFEHAKTGENNLRAVTVQNKPWSLAIDII
jgi:hypothetical protein